jgi:Ca2+-binding EF-hand superfamily protein
MNKTSFGCAEIHKWHNEFFKENPNGKLDKNKFLNAYRYFYPSGNPEKMCDQVFKALDVDNSGEIEFSEFLIAISATALEADDRARQTLSITFKIYDTDKNSKVDMSEMEKMIEAIYDLWGVDGQSRNGENAPVERSKEIMQRMDKNQDGCLSEEEFIEGCLADPVLKAFLDPPKLVPTFNGIMLT